MKKVYIFVIFSIFMFWISCDEEDTDRFSCKKINTVTLQPADMNSMEFNENDSATYSCFPATCFNRWGTKCVEKVDTETKLQVGHRHVYHHGTDPCNCWRYVDCVYRGGVAFDMDQFSGKSIVGATLKWDEKGVCATRLFAPSAPWGNFALVSTEEIVTNWDENTPAGPGEIDVSEDVRAWVNGTLPNRGFLFIGDHHGFPHKSWIESDAEIGPPAFLECISAVGGISLEVLYTE